MKSSKYVHISAVLDKQLSEKINDFCRKEERSKTWVIKKAVERFLEDMGDLEAAYKRMTDPKTKMISGKELRAKLHA